MKKFTDRDLLKAYYLWKSRNKSFDDEFEQRLSIFLSDKIKSVKKTEKSYGSWLRQIRQGMRLSATEMAHKLNISRMAYSKYEENESKGSISLATLAKAAEVMDCELIYAIRPKKRKAMSEIIWEKILPDALKCQWLEKCDEKQKVVVLASVASKLLLDPDFRKKQGWSRNRK